MSAAAGSSGGSGRFETSPSRDDRLHWHAVLSHELPRLAESAALRQALIEAHSLAPVVGWFGPITHAEFVTQTSIAPWASAAALVPTEDVLGSCDVDWMNVDGLHLSPEIFSDATTPVWSVLRPWWADIVNRLRAERPESVARDTTLTIYADYAGDRLDLELRCWHGVIEVTSPFGLADDYAERGL